MKHIIPCLPELPCHQFRTCDRCAKLRQAHYAEIARAKTRAIPATFATITNIPAHDVATATALHPGQGGLWSIERGQLSAGLHVNLLFQAQQTFSATDILASAPIQGASAWATTVPPEDLPSIAAYITKRSGIPLKSTYLGRTTGTWGTWRSARSIAQTMKTAPVATAAIFEAELRALGLASETDPKTPNPVYRGLYPPPPTRAEQRELAQHWLPGLRELLR
jgi:hypothetical protein